MLVWILGGTSLRKIIKTLILVVVLTQLSVVNAYAQPIELFDTYFFSSSSQTLKARDAVTISCCSGSILEDRGDSYRLLKGIATIRTGISPISIDLGDKTRQIAANSLETVAALESNKNESTAGLALRPLHNQGESPLFVVGDCNGLQSLGKEHAISMAEGMVLFCPQNDLLIHLPLGQIHSKAGNKFLVKCTGNEIRILCCSGNGLTYHQGHKFRRIPPSQEFSIYDHRPFQAEVLPADGIGRKDVTMHDIDGQSMTAASTNFSVVSLLKSPSYLGGWQRKSARDKQLTKSIIKTAAAQAAASPSFQDFYRSPRVQDKAISPSASFRN